MLFCAKKSNKIGEIKQENKQKNRRMDYIKNSLSFLCAKIYRRQKKHLKCLKNTLINKDEYAWITKKEKMKIKGGTKMLKPKTNKENKEKTKQKRNNTSSTSNNNFILLWRKVKIQ